MPSSENLLLVTLALPLCGAVIIALVPLRGLSRPIALAAAILALATAGWLGARFASSPSEAFPAIEPSCILLTSSVASIDCSIGLDGLSIWDFGSSVLLVFTCVLVSWEAIQDRHRLFYALVLVL